MSAPAWGGSRVVVDRVGDKWLLSLGNMRYYCPGYGPSCDGTETAARIECKFGPCQPLIDGQGRPVLTLSQARAIAGRLRTTGVTVPTGDLQAAIRAITDTVPVWDEAARDWAGRPAPQDGAE